MTRILVAEGDPSVCDVFSLTMEQAFSDAVVRSATIGSIAAAIIEREPFDLAIIGYSLFDISGLELAERAANRNIPSLLCTGHPTALAQLQGSAFPHLRKPCRLWDLTREARQIIAESAENIRRVKASAARMQATLAGLQADFAETRRLLEQYRFLSAGGRVGPRSRTEPSAGRLSKDTP